MSLKNGSTTIFVSILGLIANVLMCTDIAGICVLALLFLCRFLAFLKKMVH